MLSIDTRVSSSKADNKNASSEDTFFGFALNALETRERYFLSLAFTVTGASERDG